MKIIEIAPTELTPNPFNSNHVGPDEMEKLKNSLDRHGWIRPVLIRDVEGVKEILGGQHRVEAAIELGYDSVPCVNLGKIDDKKAKEIGLVDNARYGTDDALELAEILADIGPSIAGQFLPLSDGDLASLAADLNDDELDRLLDEGDRDEEKPEPQKKEKTHQIMRFKVAIKDAHIVEDLIERTMEEQGFTEADSLTNAGDALVWLFSLPEQQDEG